MSDKCHFIYLNSGDSGVTEYTKQDRSDIETEMSKMEKKDEDDSEAVFRLYMEGEEEKGTNNSGNMFF